MQSVVTLQSSHMPERRDPEMLDYLVFFVGVPAAIAFMFSLVGIRLTQGLPYLDALGYMLLHMFTAWWMVSWGASLIKALFRSWRPPTLAICVMGYFISLIPAAFIFQSLGDMYSSIYPVFAENRADNALPSWSLAYILHFIRYSIPALPLFLAGVYGYRVITGVNWYGYPKNEPSRAAAQPADASYRRATAGLIEGSKLPNDAELLAIKAEQHYIKIHSDRGDDLVRYRFSDLDDAVGGCNGLKVHRSWWVNLDRVESHRRQGRKLELRVSDTLKVPVSLSYKNAVLQRLNQAD